MLLYLFMHIVETSTVVLGPEVYNATLGIFKNPVIRAGEVLLMAALVYHALNGLRVIAMDFLPSATAYYRPLTYGVIGATIVAMVPMAIIMFGPFAPWAEPMSVGRTVYSATPPRAAPDRPRARVASGSGGGSCASAAWRS